MVLTAKQKRKLIVGSLIAGVITIVVLLLQSMGMLSRLENISYDYRMVFARQDVRLNPEIKIVLIDEASLQAMMPVAGRFPWPREIYADLLEFFAIGGAKLVIFDILFTENERQQVADKYTDSDLRFIQATADSGNVIHAFQLIQDDAGSRGSKFIWQNMATDFADKYGLLGDETIVELANDFVLPMQGLYEVAAGVGTVTMDPDSDGVFRRINLFSRYQDKVYPALSMAPVVLKQGLHKVAIIDHQLDVGNRHIKLDRAGHYLVNMVAKYEPYSIAGIFSSIQKIQMGETENLIVYPDEFENKIVFVGASAVGLEDIKTTAVSAKTPGVLIHASVLSNYLSDDHLTPQGIIGSIILVVVFALISAVGILFLSSLIWQTLLPLMLASLYVISGFWLFELGYVTNLVSPVLAIGLVWLSSITYLVFTEGRDKQRVRFMFSQYVSPEVLNQVADNFEDQIQASVGKREKLSILFSDIRGFTNISEHLKAEQVVDLLNAYFSVMCDVVFNHRGTMDKYIGDAIMAFWGAPIRNEDHAFDSVATALHMARSMPEINRRMKTRGYPEIAIGIGINTAEVVLGNIGSERKLDYTVIGDGVNLASRLEGLTKQYGVPVIISEFTQQQIQDRVPCALLDMVRVKGKQVPIRIYWPLVLPGDEEGEWQKAEQLAEKTCIGFNHYVDGNWSEAIKQYSSLPESKFRSIFIERCENYLESPPQGEWDGVYTLTTK
ncbi:MAG: adenylate/guanylate cyclase domain-containing protein [Gammaproteobacteria bacterium]|nr:adenylate/guanylate cyclase domain-containing protein [Gammaproteobacteria bacterium]